METMTESKHTPEPWEYVGGDDSSIEINIGETTATLTRYDKNSGVPVISREEMEANGRLVAAAPATAAERDKLKEINKELVEALESATNKLKSIGSWSKPGEQAYDTTGYEELLSKAKQ